jgi:hypothetical protein
MVTVISLNGIFLLEVGALHSQQQQHESDVVFTGKKDVVSRST